MLPHGFVARFHRLPAANQRTEHWSGEFIQRTWLAALITLAALAMIGIPLAQAQQPIAVTGFNADVIIDKDVSARVAHTYDGNRIAWFEAAAVDDEGVEHDDGVPAGQNATSATGSGVVYAIQPAAGNNILRIARTEDGTLTLNTPAPYTSLWVLASSGSGGNMDDVIINYDDGTSHFFRSSYDASDWCDNSQRGAITGLGRANPIGGYGLNLHVRARSGTARRGWRSARLDPHRS